MSDRRADDPIPTSTITIAMALLVRCGGEATFTREELEYAARMPLATVQVDPNGMHVFVLPENWHPSEER
jgi:hypothetical protein